MKRASLRHLIQILLTGEACESNQCVSMQRLLGPGVRSVPTSCSFAGTWLCPVTPHTVVQAQNEEGRIMDVVSLLVYSLPPSLASCSFSLNSGFFGLQLSPSLQQFIYQPKMLWRFPPWKLYDSGPQKIVSPMK